VNSKNCFQSFEAFSAQWSFKFAESANMTLHFISNFKKFNIVMENLDF
jgi:hypothetical protein